MASNALSREILKWVQSLDLAYSVKNPKRDFANGFLVAEIFSHYYESDVHMHGYSNGTSLEQKRDNWEQLTRFFKKRGIEPEGQPIAPQEINDIMKCKAGAVVLFLNKIYTFLTGRKVQAPPARTEADHAPAFAKSTAAHAIRETLRDPGIEAITDLSTKESKMREALSLHQTSLAEDKLKDPTRYKRSAKVVRGSTRTVGHEESKSSVEIKQVAVKSVDSNVAHLRATKELQASTARIGATGASSRSVLPDLSSGGVQPALETLNSCVKSVLEDRDEFRLLDATVPEAHSLVDVMTSNPEFPHALGASAFREMGSFSALTALVEAATASPREFYLIIGVFQPAIAQFPESSPAFSTAVDTLMSLGKLLIQKDASLGVKLFKDFALPSFLPLAKTRPTKRHAVMRVFYAFSEPSPIGRLQAIRTLQDSLRDLPSFLHCLTVLVFLEDSFNDDLIDLYLYYTLIGMGMSSPPLRAACLAMLSVIAVQSPEVVVGAVDRLVMLRTDRWWEVRAQLLIVCSTLLQKLTPATDSHSVRKLIDLVSFLLRPENGSVVLRVGVAYISKILRSHPSLIPKYVRVVLALPSEARERLLNPTGPRDQLSIAGASGGRYHLPCAATEWPADLIARELCKLVVDEELEHLEMEHFQLLVALVRNTDGPGALSESAAATTFKSLENHILVGFCDDEGYGLALQVLQYLLDGSLGLGVLHVDSFPSTLTLLHQMSDPAPTHQVTAVAEFLRDAAGRSEDHAEAVSSLLTAFSEVYGSFGEPEIAAVATSLGL